MKDKDIKKDGGKKFKKTGKKGKNLQKLKKDELGWLAKNTRFAPGSISAWHKVGEITFRCVSLKPITGSFWVT